MFITSMHLDSLTDEQKQLGTWAKHEGTGEMALDHAQEDRPGNFYRNS